MPPFFMKHDMRDTTESERKDLRRSILAQRSRLTAKESEVFVHQLLSLLFTLPEIQANNCFFVYCSYKTEVPTKALIDRLLAMDKIVAVPLTDPKNFTMEAVVLSNPDKDLISGYKGIPEPDSSLIPEKIISPACIEVAFVPGSVFDVQGNRLGYGGGFYDRFLTHKAPQALRIGLAFSLQVMERIPHQAHDVPMDMVVTEKEIFTRARGNVV